jgi:TonB family protein
LQNKGAATTPTRSHPAEGYLMLDVLLESRAVRTPRPLYEAIISAAVHGALLVALVVGPSLANRAFDPNDAESTPPVYIAPPDRFQPKEQHVQFMAVGGGETARRDETTSPASDQLASAATNQDRTDLSVRRADQADDAYSVLEVDSAAVRDPSSAAPAYPPAMMSLAIEGAATIRFVVDTTGRADLATVHTVTATNPAFEHAVLEALPRMRFHPARIGHTLVRQMESEEFKFQLKRYAVARP